MTDPIKTATLVKVYGKKVWVESDLFGSRHVMVQHDAPGEDPFTYCSFHYDYRHTCNSQTWGDANRMALSLGATEPVEHRNRELPKLDATAAPVVVVTDAMVERAYNAYGQRCWARGETASGVTKEDMLAALIAAITDT